MKASLLDLCKSNEKERSVQALMLDKTRCSPWKSAKKAKPGKMTQKIINQTSGDDLNNLKSAINQ